MIVPEVQRKVARSLRIGCGLESAGDIPESSILLSAYSPAGSKGALLGSNAGPFDSGFHGTRYYEARTCNPLCLPSSIHTRSTSKSRRVHSTVECIALPCLWRYVGIDAQRSLMAGLGIPTPLAKKQKSDARHSKAGRILALLFALYVETLSRSTSTARLDSFLAHSLRLRKSSIKVPTSGKSTGASSSGLCFLR